MLLIFESTLFADDKKEDSFSCKQELDLRDSIIVSNDSVFRLKESLYKNELQLEKEQKANYESSYNLMKKEYSDCSFSLQKTVEKAEAEGVSQVISDTLSNEQTSSSSKTKIAFGATFLSGMAIGAFLFSLFF
ncbi:MAG TPA: hypothetical protein PK616_07150 [Fibrobacteraceae bacterium]|nr:hypothetical protein [Fibrobacteraceae bacterium]